MVRFTPTVLVTSFFLYATSTVAQTQPTGASAFVSSDKSFSFALNIPEDEGSNDLYFTMQGTDASWIAAGLGSRMANSLIFIAYPDSSGKNVTLSPRLSYGNVEPSYTPDVTVEVLPGSSVIGGVLKVNARCRKCRAWKGGSINPTDSAANFIFASGGGAMIQSNSLAAPLKRHFMYGSFSMDLTKAVGPAYAPDSFEESTAGSVETNNYYERRDFSGPAHAAIMIFTFVGLLPLGVMILRVFKSPKWHGVAQGISMALALAGMAIGIMMGMKYNRTKNFNSAHQIIGMIVIAGLIGQFVLGFLHHRIFTKTQSPTKLAPVHVWLGRLVIVLGITNGFVGFPLALNPKYDLALLAVVLAVAIVFGPFAFWRYRRDLKRKNASASTDDFGYQSQPWVTPGQSRSDVQLGQMQPHPPPYQGRPPTQGRQFV